MIKILVLVYILSTESKVDTLASIITAECSICSEKEQYLVGSTVLNRVDHEDFPNTIKDVICEPNQYLGVNSKWFTPTPKTMKVARNLLKGVNRDKDVLYFYGKNSTDKSFIKKMKNRVKYVMNHHNYAI